MRCLRSRPSIALSKITSAGLAGLLALMMAHVAVAQEGIAEKRLHSWYCLGVFKSRKQIIPQIVTIP